MNRQFTVVELFLIIAAFAVLVLGYAFPPAGIALGTTNLILGGYLIFHFKNTSDVVGKAMGKGAIIYTLLLYAVSAAGYFA